MQNIPMRVPCNWIQEDRPMENLGEIPEGRFMFFMSTGNVANICCKVDWVTEDLYYPTWCETIEEDKPILKDVGWIIWESLLMEKKTFHVEFAGQEG
jgi:hypothetical protein